jgi:hypothetical protein
MSCGEDAPKAPDTGYGGIDRSVRKASDQWIYSS